MTADSLTIGIFVSSSSAFAGIEEDKGGPLMLTTGGTGLETTRERIRAVRPSC